MIDHQRLLPMLKQAWLESGGIYGYRKITLDMRPRRTMWQAPCVRASQARRPALTDGRQAQARRQVRPACCCAPNHLQQVFTVSQANQVWGTDITYIRTYDGCLYLSVVMSLYSRQVIGWSMGSRIDTDLVLAALLIAFWRRKPKAAVTLHSDQGYQSTSYEWQDLLKSHNLVASMSRRGNRHDNAVAESFFQLLKRERIRRKIRPTRDLARSDVFHCIEMFYKPRRRHEIA